MNSTLKNACVAKGMSTTDIQNGHCYPGAINGSGSTGVYSCSLPGNQAKPWCRATYCNNNVHIKEPVCINWCQQSEGLLDHHKNPAPTIEQKLGMCNTQLNNVCPEEDESAFCSCRNARKGDALLGPLAPYADQDCIDAMLNNEALPYYYHPPLQNITYCEQKCLVDASGSTFVAGGEVNFLNTCKTNCGDQEKEALPPAEEEEEEPEEVPPEEEARGPPDFSAEKKKQNNIIFGAVSLISIAALGGTVSISFLYLPKKVAVIVAIVGPLLVVTGLIVFYFMLMKAETYTKKTEIVATNKVKKKLRSRRRRSFNVENVF
jgi:hypothetical protein